MAKKDKKATNKVKTGTPLAVKPQAAPAVEQPSVDQAVILSLAIDNAKAELKKFRTALSKAVELVSKSDHAVMKANEAVSDLATGNLGDALDGLRSLIPVVKKKKSSSKAK